MADHGARAHAEYAPSAAYRWMRCHGSVRLSRGFDTGKSSIYAEEGTQCHEASERVLRGDSFEDATQGLSDEQKLIVEEYTDFCLDVTDAMSEIGEVDVHIERRMHAPGISAKFFGTGDYAVVAQNRTGVLRFIDLKAGATPVYVRDREGRINPQLGSYLLLMLAELGAPVSPWRFDPATIGVKRLKITIVQPKVYDAPQTTVVEFEELEEFLGDVCRAIDAIEGGDDTLKAGDWCKFCPAKGACPELRAEAVRKAQMDFEAPNPFPFAEWAAILEEAELIAAHVNGIRSKIRTALEQGHKVPGFKLVAKRERQEWIDFEETADQFGHLSPFPIYKHAPLSPAAMKKAAKLAKLKFDFEPHIVKKSGGLTIAPADDPRPEIIRDPGADFAVDDGESED